MTDGETAALVARMRVTAAAVMGFHALAEDEERPPSPVDRVRYEAHVYASGVALAEQVARLMALLDDRGR